MKHDASWFARQLAHCELAGADLRDATVASWYARQLAHCDAVLAHLERQHTQDEIERAVERARRDAEGITGQSESG